MIFVSLAFNLGVSPRGIDSQTVPQSLCTHTGTLGCYHHFLVTVQYRNCVRYAILALQV